MTISETFHASHLSSLPVRPIHCLLKAEGAGGQAVPYLGYVEANLTFPHTVTSTEVEQVVLALTVPGCHFNRKTPL